MLHAVKLQHGDLHSGNVLYDEDSDSVYLADFGLSRSSTCHKVCTGTTGTCIASLVVTQLTPWAGFLAPEVAAALWQGPPADLWAAGVLFASLLEAFMPCLKYYEQSATSAVQISSLGISATLGKHQARGADCLCVSVIALEPPQRRYGQKDWCATSHRPQQQCGSGHHCGGRQSWLRVQYVGE